MTLRMNVRNWLVPLTVAEVQDELDWAIEQGETEKAGYIEEFLHELEAEFDGCETDDDWD
jgi:hypothetical protein